MKSREENPPFSENLPAGCTGRIATRIKRNVTLFSSGVDLTDQRRKMSRRSLCQNASDLRNKRDMPRSCVDVRG
jgi:hypothetical protein